LYDITAQIEQVVRQWGVIEGICHLFVQHTSASLVASESYDPSARKDLEAFMDHLVLEDQPYYRHTLEGSDDSPSHMRTMLTNTSLSIPIDSGKLSLGTWQGLYLFEHRLRPHRRRVLVRCLSVEET
jgi:secondary thiamine-phosphate synthase enzyme